MDPRSCLVLPAKPSSAVSAGVGLAGLAGLLIWIAIARHWGMDGTWSALAGLAAAALPMIVWSLAIDRVHRHEGTGMSMKPLRSWKAAWQFSRPKLAGLWVTWGTIAGFYSLNRLYWVGDYVFAMEVLSAIGPILILVSVPYLLWIDRHLHDPRDASWHFGSWLFGLKNWSSTEVKAHIRAWAVKSFFLAFMLSILPNSFGRVVALPLDRLLASPVELVNWLISLLFVVDIVIATIGYGMTLRPLNAHIRSVDPSIAGWVAALACYPPFHLIGEGRAIDYRPGTWGEDSWSYWLAEHPSFLAVWGACLVLLIALYTSATLAFGLRFSNLTHRGILTHGPYALTKHPAYLAKNGFWWAACLPFLVTTDSLIDAARNVAGLVLVNAIYFWRARTEERHLSQDPTYRAYAEWMAEQGFVARLAGVASRSFRGRNRKTAR